MIRFKRMIAMILMLVFVLPLAGCWNRRELSTLGIVGVIGVDAANNGLKSTFGIYKPEKAGKDSEDSKTPGKFVQTEGRTLQETLRNSPLRFDRKLFSSHAKVVLFSEEIARNGLADHLDNILRGHEMRLTMRLAIVKDSSAADVMGIASGINTMPSSYIEDLFKQHKVHAFSLDTNVLDFLKGYAGKGKNPVLAVIQKVKKPKIGNNEDEDELSVEGSAVFLKDKFVGYLDGKETRGYNFVVGKVNSSIVTFPTPDSNGLTSVEVLKAKSKNDVEISGDTVKITVKIDVNGMLDEQTINIDASSPSALIAILEPATSQAIKQEVEHTLLKVQREYKSDIFGFGQLVHRKYPKEWKTMQDNWDEIFSQADIEVEVGAKITKTGKSSYPVVE